ncbi:MarR family transcriptional regulator [Pusillimonas sp. CC-YST705]|uniref:MarR family transcriptional regulator n=1 Tax=Mesopusillimonas faecipullorum TaxID=2755040 RepID=A0ABS8CAA4_9BURK|nr:MarR family transcriptional regulator [Mesopusillimonas faecipullorum]
MRSALPALSEADWSLQQNVAFRMDSITSRLNQELRDSVLRDLDLTYAHFRVLQVLFEVDGQQIGDIARSIAMRQPALSRVIDQMETRKLVRRKQDKDDSRYMRVFLTPAGKRSYEQAWPEGHQIIVRALEAISPDEREQLLELLKRIDLHTQKK